jgi:hypothetical protein
MKKRNIILGVSALAFTLILAGGLLVSQAHGLSQTSKDALIKGDYNGFKSSITEGAKKRVDNLNEDKFKEMSENFKKMEELKTKTEQSIKDNDFESFKKLHEERKALHNSKKSNDNRPNRPQPKELTNDELKAKFDKMVEQYKKDGTFSHPMEKGGKRNHFDKR